MPLWFARRIKRYLLGISGPLLDPVDIHIEVPRLSSQELLGRATGEFFATASKRVVASGKKQSERIKGIGITCNVQMKAKWLRNHGDMDAVTKDLLRAVVAQFSLSERGYDGFLTFRVPLPICGIRVAIMRF